MHLDTPFKRTASLARFGPTDRVQVTLTFQSARADPARAIRISIKKAIIKNDFFMVAPFLKKGASVITAPISRFNA